MSNLRCIRLRDVAGLEVNPIFFLATAHSIFQFEEVNSKDEISSPQLLYLDSLEIQVDESSMHIFGLRISDDISIAKH